MERIKLISVFSISLLILLTAQAYSQNDTAYVYSMGKLTYQSHIDDIDSIRFYDHEYNKSIRIYSAGIAVMDSPLADVDSIKFYREELIPPVELRDTFLLYSAKDRNWDESDVNNIIQSGLYKTITVQSAEDFEDEEYDAMTAHRNTMTNVFAQNTDAVNVKSDRNTIVNPFKIHAEDKAIIEQWFPVFEKDTCDDPSRFFDVEYFMSHLGNHFSNEEFYASIENCFVQNIYLGLTNTFQEYNAEQVSSRTSALRWYFSLGDKVTAHREANIIHSESMFRNDSIILRGLGYIPSATWVFPGGLDLDNPIGTKYQQSGNGAVKQSAVPAGSVHNRPVQSRAVQNTSNRTNTTAKNHVIRNNLQNKR